MEYGSSKFLDELKYYVRGKNKTQYIYIYLYIYIDMVVLLQVQNWTSGLTVPTRVLHLEDAMHNIDPYEFHF